MLQLFCLLPLLHTNVMLVTSKGVAEKLPKERNIAEHWSYKVNCLLYVVQSFIICNYFVAQNCEFQ